MLSPVKNNFRYKANVEHGNEYHIKRKLCITGGGGSMFHFPKTTSHKKVYHKVYYYLFDYLK